ncbi:hypothetical protein GCU67_18665 [Modestobacter muralis]|uniref:DUF2567 domain-containing protein n=1 Tax=Modestobacter muralis TaxID=1608614 RepID=A0A6P0HB51_9ACTN|nr:hypothetical protein [Modestobacter muralis]NEK96173.1 hypothetical protein [Modestobacter muralis]NEN53061.1 hypothetical protein [Modestobacter muralis]
MSRAARWPAPVLGALLCAVGVGVFWWTNASSPGVDGGWFAYVPVGEAPPQPDGAYQSELSIAFDDAPWSVLWTTGHLVGLGLALAGLLVLSGWGGRLLGRRAAGPARVAWALGAAGALLVVGVVLALTAGPEPVVTYSGSYEPLACPDATGCAAGGTPLQLGAGQLVGLAAAALGSAALAAVCGWVLGRDQRTAVPPRRLGPG